MEIYNEDQAPLNFDERLQPLFDAMARGEKIKSITCIAGQINKDDPSKDFKIKDFRATDYWVGMMSNRDGSEHHDYVDVEGGTVENSDKPREAFYMSWVKEFELY